MRWQHSAEAQIDSATSAVQRELDADTGDNTMEVEPEKKPAAPAKPAAAPAAAPAAEKPAEQK